VDIFIFNQALAQLSSEYIPQLEAARLHLYNLECAYAARKHELAVQYGYTNAVIKALKAGQSVFVHHFTDNECYLSVAERTMGISYTGFEYSANLFDDLAVEFVKALEYGLIVEGVMDDERNVPFTLTPPSA